jgi:FAD:protein FMN transferase
MAGQLMADAITSLPPRYTWVARASGNPEVAVAERDALGTTARVAFWPASSHAAVVGAVDTVLTDLDQQASRFRPDSEISALMAAGGGRFSISSGLAEAIGVALAAARWTGGLVDPTVGGRLCALGYDRDFAEIADRDPGPGAEQEPPAGVSINWQAVRLTGLQLELPAGVTLDLGATGKGLGADRAARSACTAAGAGGVLVSLGGDIAVAGHSPAGGWPVLIADDHRQDGLCADGRPEQVVRIIAGAVATSSIGCRQWRRGGRWLHHIVDPRTGQPADGPWRTVSVAAASCAEANAASTAAIVAGDSALEWLASTGLPARLVARTGTVRTTGGWPGRAGGRLPQVAAAMRAWTDDAAGRDCRQPSTAAAGAGDD